MAATAGAVGVAIGRSTATGRTAAAPVTVPDTTASHSLASTTTLIPPSTSPAPAVSSAGPARAFAGEWSVHTTLLVVDPTGYGILAFRTYSTCGQDPPPCDIFSGNDIFDAGHATFTFSASGPTTASGQVLTTTVPTVLPLGRFTARIDPAKDLLYLSLPLFAHYPLCGPTARALTIDQQRAAGINCGA